MYKLGLKLWSDNQAYADEIKRLRIARSFDYIELYSMPDTFTKHIDFWIKIGGPFVIHAPHFGHGVNLSLRETETRNRRLIDDARLFADKLNANCIIVHPGVNGHFHETIHQLLTFNDTRLVIENKPHLGFTDDQVCVGSRPADMESMLNATGLNFCLDIGHAIYAANGLGINPIDHLAGFLKLRPTMYHFTDGDWNAVHDVHTRYGKGTFPLAGLLSLIPDDSMLTNEAGKSSKVSLSDFESDSCYLKELSGKTQSLVSIRSAKLDDARNLYELSMDPLVRASSLKSESFSFESHLEWFKLAIFDNSRRIYICEINNQFVGQIRFVLQDNIAVISISIIEFWRNTGVAPRLFRYAVDRLVTSAPAINQIIATVKCNNGPSNKFFQKLGFTAISGNPLVTSDSNIEYCLELK